MVTTGHETGTRMIDVDCDCHMMIDEVSAETNSYGTSVKCKLSVLGCTDPNQVGKTISEFFKADGEVAGMFLNLAQAARLITLEQRQAAHKAGVGMQIDETLLKGRQICCKVRMKPNMQKNTATGQMQINPEKPGPFPRIGFDTFDVWDKKAEGIPKDPQFLAMWPKLASQAAAPAMHTAPPQHAAPAPSQQSLPLGGPANPPALQMNW